ncbi:PLDc N-terminal domain-containing protein [Nocardia sp. CNY236]|uniref:PLDc N-terminal domain-containing protein n=1 Tax=Nocardia sp. CNY236 TaxID=1169152 RepID=UPI00055E408B|nr:PLDc N-terminal domain-containing protein [Nocardia sp. CNY236]
MPIEAVVPLVLIGLAFVVFCWWDLYRAPHTRVFGKSIWAVLCVVTIPLGGLAYLVFGRPR